MNILETIANHKRQEVDYKKSLYPIKLLEKSIFFNTYPLSLKKYITREDLSGIIAEFKRKSPSKGIINQFDTVERVTVWYMQAGASALSILTDEKFFGGSNNDLITARKYNFCPILRKDFIIDEYQIIEAKSIGADAILLIASLLNEKKVLDFAKFAKSLDLEVILEIHNENEINSCNEFVDIVGVNNRDLKTFNTNINISKQLADIIPSNFIKISESGINSTEDVSELKKYGYKGFLIGEKFMKSSRPGKACKNFIKNLKN